MSQAEMVQIDVPVSVEGGEIKVPEQVNLESQPRNVKLRWVMNENTRDWVFADNGIAFERTSDQFSEPQKIDGGRKFQWKDKNDDSQEYKYVVHLVAADGSGQTKSLDPTVKNGDGGG